MNRLEISVLGSPTIEVDGVPVQVDTRKAIALLVYLAVAGRTQSRDRLTGLLWPNYDQERARAALRRTLSALRKALGDRWVSADRLGISLDRAGVDLDVAHLREALTAADAHEHDGSTACHECIRSLQAAAELGSGGFMQGFSLRDAEPFEEWQSLEAETVQREVAAVLDRLTRALSAAGELEAACAAAQKKLALDQLDEPAHRQLMQLYAWRGMRSAALQQYRECVAILDRELGVSPLPETTELYSAISEGAVEARETSKLIEPSAPARTVTVGGGYSLQGRSAEWERMASAYASVGAGGVLIAIEGEAGIGKTRLGRDFVDALGVAGAKTVTARSHEGEAGLPYALVADILQPLTDEVSGLKLGEETLVEIARLIPRLQVAGRMPPPIDDPGALGRFFEAVRVALMGALHGGKVGVLLLDELHWCDTASLDVVAYLLRRLDETPLCVVAAFRTEEIDQDHPLRLMIEEASRSAAVVSLRLGRLGLDDVSALVAEAGLPASDRPDVTARLMEETEGIPFFVVEYLAALVTGAGGWEMPASIKDLLRSRSRLVGQTARQVLGAAAVIDRSFDYDTVWRSSGRTELETVDALEELVAYGLVLPSGTGAEATYEFSHEKLRTFVYESMSPARRRVLHRRVAEAFVGNARRQDHLRSLSSLVARHYELGGLEAEAARYHELAAGYARDVFANREALDHFLRALALGHPDPAVLHEGAGDMYVLLGEYKRAIGSYETAAALAPHDAIARIEHRLGEVHLRRGDWDLSQSHLIAALETLDNGADVERARILATMSFNALRKGEWDGAEELAQRARDSAVTADDDRALARAQNQLGILENARGNHDRAIEHLRSSLELATQLEDAAGRVAALNNLAHAARSLDELDEALALTEEALEICTEQGDSHRAAALHNNIADLLHSSGDTEGAMEHLKRSTAVLAKIGEEPSGLLPEVWKLVEW